MPSIKVLNISLVLLCIFTTAFVCTFLAITSSEKALDDTKESRDVSVGSCFAIGEESVTNRTTEYMDLLMDSTVGYLTQFTLQHRLVSVSLAKEAESEPWDTVKMWDWHRKARYFHAFDLLRPEGSTGTVLILKNKLTIVYGESYETFSNPPDGLHTFVTTFNYGDDHPWGGLGRTAVTYNDAEGKPIGYENPFDIQWADDAYLCIDKFEKGNRTGTFACNNTNWVDPTQRSIMRYASLLSPTSWTPPVVIDKYYLTLLCGTPVYHDGAITGIAASSVDLRHFSKHLSQLEVGGPVAGYPSRGRVYITLRASKFPLPTRGELLGASHGSVITTLPDGTPEALTPGTSSDPVISSIATAAEGLDLEGLAASSNLTVLNITTDLAPEGEDFYYRIGHLADTYGLDWYVHLVIDREYILGTIDKKTAETRDEIKASEEKVDDDLKTARTILYVTVVAVAVALTVLSVVFVLNIINPLVVLEKEMAAVAVMKLEEVDTNRPLSALGEVRLMQVSFLQMIQNLVEYRNYMPASVLQADEDSDEDAATRPDIDSSYEVSMTASRTSGSSWSGTAKGQTSLAIVSDVRTKRVTLMVCNIVGFLKVREPLHIQELIGGYLAAGLQYLKAAKGIPDSFSGDRLYASWNGVRTCVSHRTAAYLCARDMITKNICGERVGGLSIGLASGSVVCGNMGCEGMKKYSYIGSLSSWVHVVERIGRSMECDVAISSTVNEEVKNTVYTRMLQHVKYEKHGHAVLQVYEGMKQKAVAAEEWMYELREGDSNDPNKAYNASYELFMEGNVAEAVKVLGQYDDGTKTVQLYKARLRRAVGCPELCHPVVYEM